MRHLIRSFLPALLLAALPVASQAGVAVGVSINIAPPALPVYVQPPIPAPGYVWTPGYWAWGGEDGYYWVPGTWVLAPVGMLWTPGYWGWGGGLYLWHAGYWGPHVGFYGGINYGFGYGGVGFGGGYWQGGQYFYNRSVTNVTNVTNITNVYNKTVVNNTTVNRVSFNGGTGGVAARPNAEEQAAEHERHVGVTEMQKQHEQMARSDTSLRASVNGGRPAIAATARPAVFKGNGVVAARESGAPGRAQMNRADRPPQGQRPANERPAAERPGANRPAMKDRPAASDRPPGGPNAGHGNPNAGRGNPGSPAARPQGERRAGPGPGPGAGPGRGGPPQGERRASPGAGAGPGRGGPPQGGGRPRERQGGGQHPQEQRQEHGRGG